MPRQHIDKIPESRGMKSYGGRAGKPTGMGSFNKGDLVVVDTPHGLAKGLYQGYSQDYFHHEVNIRGVHESVEGEGRRRIANMIGQRHLVAGEDTHRIRPNTDPADIEHEAKWQGYLGSQWRDRRG